MPLVLILLLLVLMLPATSETEPTDLPGLLDGIERTFSRMRDLSADFVQIYQDPLNRKQEQAGHVYLMRPKMRWEAETPEKTLFVSVVARSKPNLRAACAELTPPREATI